MGIRHNHVAAGDNDPTKEVSRDRWNEDHVVIGVFQLGGLAADPGSPPDGTLWLNTATGEVKVRTAGTTLPIGGGGGPTDLSYDAASRVLSSSTGADATLPLASGTNAGLMSAADFNDLNTALQPGASIPWTDVTGKPAFAAVATSGSASDLGAGTLPAARFTDASHGNRAGGTLHVDVIAGGASGFMSGADKTKLNGIATGATANATDAALRDRATHTGTQLAATIGDFAATVIGTALTGFAVAGTRTAIVATDTVLAAFGKVQKWLNDLAAVAFSGSASDLTAGTLPAARMPAQTGDVTAPAGSTVQTLATVNSNVGSFGLAGSVAQFTVNAKGLITAAANVAISIASTAISDSTAAGRAMLTAATAAAQTALLNTFTTTLKGLVPPPGTATGLFLRDDGTWAASGGGSPITVQDEGSNVTTALATLNFVGAGVTVTGGATATVTIPGGGGGSPGGVSGEIQWNNGGAFAGAADVEIEGGQLRLPAIALPAVPAAGGLKMFARDVGGRILPATMGPSGLDSPLQPHFGLNKVAWAAPLGNSTTVSTVGTSITGAGTATAKNWASTNRYTKMRGIEYLVTTAATTALCGFRGPAAQFTVGSNAAEDGGFHYICRWGPATGVATTTTRCFVGMSSATGAGTDAEASSRTLQVGMGWDAADTNIQFMHNDASGTSTKIDLGAAFPVPTVDRQEIYELAMFSPPGTTQSVSYRIRNLRTGAEASGTVTTDLPSTTTALNHWSGFSVGGTSSVIGICLFSLYVETDY